MEQRCIACRGACPEPEVSTEDAYALRAMMESDGWGVFMRLMRATHHSIVSRMIVARDEPSEVRVARADQSAELLEKLEGFDSLVDGVINGPPEDFDDATF